MEINFDVYGHLKPYELIEMEWKDFEETFVKAFEENEIRQKLYQTFQQYLTDLVDLIGETFYIWVGGSFVTTKEKPKDIDIVTFIPSDIFEEYKKELKSFSKYGIEDAYGKGLDGYLVLVYPPNHAQYFVTECDEKEWYHLFSKSHTNRKGKKLPKGFVKLSCHFKF